MAIQVHPLVIEFIENEKKMEAAKEAYKERDRILNELAKIGQHEFPMGKSKLVLIDKLKDNKLGKFFYMSRYDAEVREG